MQNNTDTYESIYSYLVSKYSRLTLSKKEVASELGLALSTLDLYMSKGISCPPYKKIGSNSKNARVIYLVSDLAKYLSEDQIETM